MGTFSIGDSVVTTLDLDMAPISGVVSELTQDGLFVIVQTSDDWMDSFWFRQEELRHTSDDDV